MVRSVNQRGLKGLSVQFQNAHSSRKLSHRRSAQNMGTKGKKKRNRSSLFIYIFGRRKKKEVV